MGSAGALLLLVLSAVLEAGGDALLRAGLHTHVPVARIAWMLLGAIALFGYGLSVNLPSWDFGRLLGAYVAVFFLVAQLINGIAFGRMPGFPILAGGALIVAGGLIITFGSDLGLPD